MIVVEGVIIYVICMVIMKFVGMAAENLQAVVASTNCHLWLLQQGVDWAVAGWLVQGWGEAAVW